MTLIEEKMRESRLGWCGYVQRCHVDAPVGRCEIMNEVDVKRGRCRLKKTWRGTIDIYAGMRVQMI